MIITKKKSFDSILNSIEKYNSVFLVGCGDCAKQCETGGEKEVFEMADLLKENKKQVTGTLMVDVLCHESFTRRKLKEMSDALGVSDCILVLSCGAGVQSVGEFSKVPVAPGCDSMYLGNIKRHKHYSHKCSTCGDCSVYSFGGICAVTRCAKGLLNAPCGGAHDGMCETNHDKDCAWQLIYENLSSQNRLDELVKIIPPKEYV